MLNMTLILIISQLVTFSTQGREFKIHTTDIAEEGAEVGLTFFPEDIHVMSKMGF